MDHFHQLREGVTEVIVTKHFKRDAPGFDTNLILDNEHKEFTHLHKFEENVEGHHIFRALQNKTHFVYAITNDHRLVFLRAFYNFKEYKKFLENKKDIRCTLSSMQK